jgi:CBS domain-containing protein
MTLLAALEQMADKNVGALVVLEEEKLVGIISERDYARRGILQGRGPETPVRDVMTTQVYYVTKEQTIEDCMAVMTDRKIRHLPVVEDDRVVGIISIGDVVNSFIDDQQHLIKGLENYITGRRA